MTLNASGPISLGGSTSGQSVDLEIGRSATAQISLNDAAVRQLTNTASGSIISLPTNFWGKLGTPAVSTYLNRTSTTEFPNVYGSLTDSSGNVYVYGPANGLGAPAGYNLWVAKFDSTGNVQYQKYYTLPYVGDSGSACIDSSGNQYYVCTDGSSYKFGYIVKLDSSGNLVWAKQLQISGAAPWNLFGAISVRLDSSGNPVALFRIQNTSTYEIPGLVVYFDTTGAITWQKYFLGSPASNFVGGHALYLDSSNNVYVLGTAFYLSTSYNVIVKINSSGTFQYSYYYQGGAASSGTSFRTYFGPSAGGTSVNSYAYYYNGSDYTLVVGTINLTTGAFTVVNAYTGVSSYQTQGVMQSDSSGNIYLLTSRTEGSGGSRVQPTNGILMRFNSSLALAYQTMFSKTYLVPNSYYPAFIGLSPNNNSVVLAGAGGNITAGPIVNSRGALMLQVPNDNSLSGTITYETSPTATTTISAASLASTAYSLYGQGTWSYASLNPTGQFVAVSTSLTVTTTTFSVERILQQ